MKGIVWTEDNALFWRYDNETIRIEPHGKDSLRIRITKQSGFPEQDWALIKVKQEKTEIRSDDDGASITCGNITAKIDKYGYMAFYNADGQLLLAEQWFTADDPDNHIPLMIYGREMKPNLGEKLCKCAIRFESNDNEKLYGMGQRQMDYMELKGCEFDLAQRNSQANIPFVLSNLGYGFFWNHPGYGRATFAKNGTIWTADACSVIDYWITAAKTPAQIVERFTEVIGRAPQFPEWATGFWQCKLRYKTQDELLSVAREYKRRNLPIKVIVIDFFHYKYQGDWCFDPEFWPDPKAMVDELHDMGIELMVSVWPTVEPNSDNYAIMKEKGYLVHTDRGMRTTFNVRGSTVFYDPTNPDARKFLWETCKKNYFDPYGIRMFWLDLTEPEYVSYDYDLYRYYLGSSLEVGSYYPVASVQAFYEGLQEAGIKDVISLTRCAGAGSQKYGAVLWSGDVQSNFKTLKIQVKAGLNAGLSGMVWWATDIGGFFGGDPSEPEFRELLIRWFQYGVFCPVFRLHGHRKPHNFELAKIDTGMYDFDVSGPNELWCFGDENYDILKELLFLRERMHEYIMAAMKKASADGTPPMRPLFFDFPNDEKTWQIEDQFMFGSDLLISPIVFKGQREREVYLPVGKFWWNVYTGEEHRGGQNLMCDAPIKRIPVFTSNKDLIALFE